MPMSIITRSSAVAVIANRTEECMV